MFDIFFKNGATIVTSPSEMNSIDDFIDSPQLEGVALPGGSSQLKSDGTGIGEKHEGILIQPKTGFVIKTKYLNQTNNAAESGEKVLINVCYHDAIEKICKKKKLDENGKEVEGLNLPLAMGSIRKCRDKNGSLCIAVDAIVHPSVKDDLDEDETGSKRDFVCQVLLQCFDQKHKEFAPLDRKYKLPRLKYFGYIDVSSGQIVRKLSENAEVCKQYVRDLKSMPKIEEVKRSPPLMKSRDSCDKLAVAKLPPLSFHVSVQLINGKEMTIDEFLAAANGKACGSWDGSLPLSIDPDKNPDYIISRVTLIASVETLDPVSTNVQTSAFALYITSSSFGRTECILPFCIDCKNVECVFHEETSELIVSAAVLNNSIDNSIDIGSRPWLLAKALSVGNDSKSTKKTQAKAQRDESIMKCLQDDDPFHLKSPFPWKNATSIANKKPKLDLPEDRFHSKDSMSQHLMQQQQDERQDKLKNSEQDRNERKRDGSMEYVNAEDFKPGGKYSGMRTNVSDGADSEHDNALKNAEIMLKNCETITSEDNSWYKLF